MCLVHTIQDLHETMPLGIVGYLKISKDVIILYIYVTKPKPLLTLLNSSSLNIMSSEILGLPIGLDIFKPYYLKREFIAQGLQLKGSGAQSVFSTTLPVTGRYMERNRRTQVINALFQDWNYQNLRFYNHGKVFKMRSLLGPDETHPSQWRKLFFFFP